MNQIDFRDLPGNKYVEIVHAGTLPSGLQRGRPFCIGRAVGAHIDNFGIDEREILAGKFNELKEILEAA